MMHKVHILDRACLIQVEQTRHVEFINVVWNPQRISRGCWMLAATFLDTLVGIIMMTRILSSESGNSGDLIRTVTVHVEKLVLGCAPN